MLEPTLHFIRAVIDFQRKIDASGSKMEFLSGRFEIETTMFSLKPFLSENVEKEGYYLNPSILEHRDLNRFLTKMEFSSV